MTKMRAMVVDEHGPVETIQEAELPIPTPGSEVSDLSLGDPVFGHLAYTRGTWDGTFADFTVAG